MFKGFFRQSCNNFCLAFQELKPQSSSVCKVNSWHSDKCLRKPVLLHSNAMITTVSRNSLTKQSKFEEKISNFSPRRTRSKSSFLSTASTVTSSETYDRTAGGLEMVEDARKIFIDHNTNNIILFDGVCNFCNTWVDILLRVDDTFSNRDSKNQKLFKFKFTPLQSSTGQTLLTAIGKRPDDISSVVLVKNNILKNSDAEVQNSKEYSKQYLLESYDKSACVLKVVEELGLAGRAFASSVRVLLPPSFRDTIYDTVAKNRYNLLGKRDECRVGDPIYFDRFIP